MAGLALRGLHAYDGHIHDEDIKVRMTKADDAMKQVFDLVNRINYAGLPKPFNYSRRFANLPHSRGG